NRHGPRITLVAVCLQIHAHKRLIAIDYYVWNAVSRVGSPVRMHVHRTHPVRNNCVGVRIDRSGGDICIPKIAAGEWDKAVQARALTGRHPVAGEIATTGPAAIAPSTAASPVPS